MENCLLKIESETQTFLVIIFKYFNFILYLIDDFLPEVAFLCVTLILRETESLSTFCPKLSFDFLPLTGPYMSKFLQDSVFTKDLLVHALESL